MQYKYNVSLIKIILKTIDRYRDLLNEMNYNIITSPKRPRVPAERRLSELTRDVPSYHHCCSCAVGTYVFSDRFSKLDFVKTAMDSNNYVPNR